MNEQLERPNRIPWPPIIYCVAIILAIALHYAFPLPWFTRPLSDILLAIGVIVIIAGLAIDFSAMATLHRAHTTIMPNKGSDHLVSKGPYAFSRNPIYLGNTLLMIGVGMVSGIAWFVILAFAAAYVTSKLAIEREEHHLSLRFGKSYRDYQKRVRRWI